MDAANKGGAGKARAKTDPKQPKGITMFDFQFFDQEAVREIETREHDIIRLRRSLQLQLKDAKARESKRAKSPTDETTGDGVEVEATPAPSPEVVATDSAVVDDEVARIERQLEEAQISEEDKAAKERLISEAFTSWNRRDFRAYVAACERFGRNDSENVALSVMEQTGKPKPDIKKYHKAFWENFRSLQVGCCSVLIFIISVQQQQQDWEKIEDRVRKGERTIERRDFITRLLDRKIQRTANPFQVGDCCCCCVCVVFIYINNTDSQDCIWLNTRQGFH